MAWVVLAVDSLYSKPTCTEPILGCHRKKRKASSRHAVICVNEVSSLAVNKCLLSWPLTMHYKRAPRLDRHYTVFSIHSSLACNGIGRLSGRAVRSLVVISQSAYSRVRTSADRSHVASHFIGGKVSCARS